MKTSRCFLILFFLFLGISSFSETDANFGKKDLDEKTRIRIELMEQEVQILRKENERLKKDLKQYQLQDMALDFQKEVSRIRNLEIKEPLRSKFLTKDDVRNYVLREIDRQYPGDTLHDYENVLARLGFIPHGTDIKKMIISLYTEQAAGFYDDATKWFYVVEEFDLNQTITGVIISHEICHVLQDQNFNIDSMNLYKRNNDDEIYAILSVLEGDATILMTEWLKENFEFKSVFQVLSSLGMDQTAYNEAPYFLQQLLVFPYIHGSMFLMEVMAQNGVEGRDIPFRNLPRSTEQILHPEKYLSLIDDPTTVSLPGAVQFGKAWEKKYENSIGEIGFKLLFEQYMTPNDALEAAAGWDGDRYALYKDENEKFMILWDSVWDSDHDANEATKAFLNLVDKRYPTGKGTTKNEMQHAWKLPREDGNGVSRIFFKRDGNRLRLGMASDNAIAARAQDLPF
ncbi:hypothetical protein JW926_00395 [Candidatus Sumerlaeota bacterium]|nr:hypothetical protein [Candidatus Sumerlaeota bacterium]